MYYFGENYNDELYHYGVPGMKWGQRKANPDAYTGYKVRRKQAVQDYKTTKNVAKAKLKSEKQLTPEEQAAKQARRKKALKVGVAVGATAVGTALATYGAYKLNKYVKSKNCQIAAKRGYEHAEKMFAMREHTEMTRAALPGSTRTVTLTSGSGKAARDAASRASNANFRTAAKNVMDYRRENGKGSLQYLQSVGSYGPGSSVKFTKRG